MKPEVTAIVNEVRGDKVHGAGWISRKVLDAMRAVILESTAQDVTGLGAELREVQGELVATRPSMIPVANLVSRLIQQMVHSFSAIYLTCFVTTQLSNW